MRYTSIASVMTLALLAAACGPAESPEPEAVEPGVDQSSTSTAGDDAVADAGDETSAVEAPASEPTAGPTPEPTSEPTPTPTPTATATPKPAPAPKPAAVAAASTPPASFTQCKICHAVEPGKNGIGPTLAGVFGAKAGHISGFEYSQAMLDSGLVWNQAGLDRYLKAPMKEVPGTKMSFAGVNDDAKRKEIIAYLKTL